MKKIFKIKEISSLTSITTRALRYYDKINLLTPSDKAQSGHRLYSENDILRLQQIIALKYMGFSLKQISNILSNPLYDAKNSLRAQITILKDEAERVQSLVNLLQSLTNQLDTDDTINWTTLTKIIEVMQMDEINKESWYEKFLSTLELKEFEALRERFSDDFWDMYHRRWSVLYAEVESNLHTSPESTTGMLLAKKWLDLVDEIYPRDSALRKKMWEAYKAGAMPKNDALPYNPEIINYITKATEIYKRQQNRLG